MMRDAALRAGICLDIADKEQKTSNYPNALHIEHPNAKMALHIDDFLL